MNGQLKLTISIVNTNNRDLLLNCLKSIYETVRKATFEIILVDNCSNDHSAEIVREKFKDVIIIQNDKMNGYGYSHNRAIRIAKGKYVLIFNEDMIVKEHAIDLMVERIEKDKNIGVLGCKLINSDGNLQYESCSNFPSIKQHFIDTFIPRTIAMKNNRSRRFLYYWDYDKEKEVDIIQGSCMLIPRKILREVGNFDTRFYVYSEEDDLCRRVKNRGYRIICYPRAEIVHIGGQTSKKMSLRMALIMIESKMKYYQKHHNEVELALFQIIMLCGNLLRLIGWSIRSVIKRSNWDYNKSHIIMNFKSIELVAKNMFKRNELFL